VLESHWRRSCRVYNDGDDSLIKVEYSDAGAGVESIGCGDGEEREGGIGD
jgi:hypothetical protein